MQYGPYVGGSGHLGENECWRKIVRVFRTILYLTTLSIPGIPKLP